jgi:hypothetical protein
VRLAPVGVARRADARFVLVRLAVVALPPTRFAGLAVARFVVVRLAVVARPVARLVPARRAVVPLPVGRFAARRVVVPLARVRLAVARLAVLGLAVVRLPADPLLAPMLRRASLMSFSTSLTRSRPPRLRSLPSSESAFSAESSDSFRRSSGPPSFFVCLLVRALVLFARAGDRFVVAIGTPLLSLLSTTTSCGPGSAYTCRWVSCHLARRMPCP